MKRRSVVFTIIVILALVGCDSRGKNQNDISGKKDVIRIGAIFSMTGVAGDYGKKSKEGFEIAIDLINKKGGIKGKQIFSIVEDAKSSPKDALSALKKITEFEKIEIVVGDVYSSTTKAMIENLKENVVLFAPGASKPDLINTNKNFIRNWTSDNFDGLAMANIVLDRGVKSIGLITEVTEYTQSLSDAFEKEYMRKNGKIVMKESFLSDKKDLRPLLLKFKNSEINNVYLTGLSKEVGLILKQAMEINYLPQWYTNLTVDTEDCRAIAGIARNGVIFSRPFVDFTDLSSDAETFLKIYKKRFDREPDATVAHAFDAVNILALAIENTDESTSQIIDYVNNLKDFPGISGKTTFNGKGGVLKDIEVLQIKQDSVLSLKVFEF